MFLLQPLFDTRKNVTFPSDRVKCIDLHPTEPMMLCALFNGHVHVINYENQKLIKDIKVWLIRQNIYFISKIHCQLLCLLGVWFAR